MATKQEDQLPFCRNGPPRRVAPQYSTITSSNNGCSVAMDTYRYLGIALIRLFTAGVVRSTGSGVVVVVVIVVIVVAAVVAAAVARFRALGRLLGLRFEPALLKQ